MEKSPKEALTTRSVGVDSSKLPSPSTQDWFGGVRPDGIRRGVLLIDDSEEDGIVRLFEGKRRVDRVSDLTSISTAWKGKRRGK